MENTVKQRLVQFVKFMHMTQKEFEDRCDMSNGYIANIRKSIGSDKLLNIVQQFPELNRDWLLYGEGDMLRQNTQFPQNKINYDNTAFLCEDSACYSQQPPQHHLPTATAHKECKCAIYPLLPSHVIRAIDTNIEEWKEQNLEQCKTIDLRELIGKVSHAQYMIGRAMEPNIPEGTLIFLREINQWDEALLDGTIYGVDVARPHMIIRKVYDDGDHIRCEPVNPEFGAVRIAKEKVMNLYKISSGWKKFD